MLAACASSNPRKALVERYWLEYSLLWCTIMGLVMIFGFGSVWSDPQLMTLGVLLGLGPLVWPLLRGTPNDTRTTLYSMYAGVTTLSFAMHYVATPFFFDVLHMHYGFKAQWRIDRNPVFLYPLTIAYFATYCACGCWAYRWCIARLRFGWPAANVVTAFALAFFETITNANPFIRDLFCYDDPFFMLTFGSVAYAVGFVFALPVWMHAVPDHNRRQPLLDAVGEARRLALRSVLGNLIAALLHGAVLLYLRHHIAPALTTVVTDSTPDGGCLGERWQLL